VTDHHYKGWNPLLSTKQKAVHADKSEHGTSRVEKGSLNHSVIHRLLGKNRDVDNLNRIALGSINVF